MTQRRLLARLDGYATRWLMAPEPNAAGRMGLFRILYTLFYLWYLATEPAETMNGYRLLRGATVGIVEVLPTLELVALRLVEAGLVAALVLLALGYRTRVATAAVLILGVAREAVFFSVDLEHATVLLVAFIPLLMLVGGHWGDTYSLDAVRMRCQGRPVVSHRESSGRYFMGARAIYVVLALLFTSAALSKIIPSSTWFTHPDLIANLILEDNVSNVIEGLPANPAAAWIARTPVVHESMRVGIVVFEFSFLVALFSATLRQLVVAVALVFHSVNALVLGVTFTPVLIAYAPFVDWQGLLDRMLPRHARLPTAKHAALFTLLALTAAGAAGSLWYADDVLERVVTVGEVLDWRTVWYLVFPAALGWLLAQLVAIGKRVVRPTSGPVGMNTP